MLEILAPWLGPLHPPLVHFPVACPLLALLALLAYRATRKPWLQEAAAWLWVLTFLGSLAAGVTGHLFALHLGLESGFNLFPPETILKGALREHVLWASASMGLSLLSLAAAWKSLRQKPWPWGPQAALALGLALAFGVTGHEGGEMVYGAEQSPALSTPAPASSGGDLLSSMPNYRQVLVQMNSREWNSRTHGHRWVNTYISKEAVKAYQNSDPMPEGAWVVKESFEDAGGKPSAVPGPLYVMRKGKASDSPSTGGWQFAMRWDRPVAGNPEGIRGPVRWLPGDPHLSSCLKCHSRFRAADYLGGVPEGYTKP